MVIAGTNERAYEFERIINKQKELGYRVKGFIDDEIHVHKNQINLLGKLSDFQDIIRHEVVDELIIALPIKSCYDKIQ